MACFSASAKASESGPVFFFRNRVLTSAMESEPEGSTTKLRSSISTMVWSAFGPAV